MASDSEPPQDNPDALSVGWVSPVPPADQGVGGAQSKAQKRFLVSQGALGDLVEVDTIVRSQLCTIGRRVLHMAEIDAARLGVILTLLADAEDCLAIREEILTGPHGPAILARSIRRQAAKSALAASAPSEPVTSSPPTTAGDPSPEPTFTVAGGPLTTGYPRRSQ